jgi:hypothetical protein
VFNYWVKNQNVKKSKNLCALLTKISTYSKYFHHLFFFFFFVFLFSQVLFYIILLCANRNTTILYNLCFIKISNLREQKNKKEKEKQMVKIFRIS